MTWAHDRSQQCLVCNETEVNHHSFEAPPPGCVCQGGDWDGCDYVPMVCRAFVPQKHDDERCATCEHNKACHATVTS